MNEMYDMGIVTHNWGVMSVLGRIDDLEDYQECATFSTPLSTTFENNSSAGIGSTVYTVIPDALICNDFFLIIIMTFGVGA